MSRSRVAVLGGGIFGVSCALELARSFDVTIFEQSHDILTGATTANHNRHHYGFHYPRSPETIEQCLGSRASFEQLYGDCLDWDFDNYYCVAETDTKTTPRDYLAVCRRFDLPVEETAPPQGILDPAKIALCLRVKEGVYDIGKLRVLVRQRLAGEPGIRLLLNHRVISGALLSDKKVLRVQSDSETLETAFDFVVNATYARTNQFSEWFGFPPKLCQFNLQELDVIELPLKRRVGITIQDGPFPSFIPIANSNRYLLAHVVQSQLVREISTQSTPLLNRVAYVESDWARILEVCSETLPILRKATLVKSIFVDRVVDAARLDDDSRLTELTDHGHGCWSVFSAKVITCVTTSRKLHEQMTQANAGQ